MDDTMQQDREDRETTVECGVTLENPKIPEFSFAHPCWITWHVVGELALRSVQSSTYEYRTKILHALKGCFKVPAEQKAKAKLECELQDPRFYTALGFACDFRHATDCLQLMFLMSRPDATEGDFERYRSDLRESEKQLRGLLGNGTLTFPKTNFKADRKKRTAQMLGATAKGVASASSQRDKAVRQEREDAKRLAREESRAREAVRVEEVRVREAARVVQAHARETARIDALRVALDEWIIFNTLGPDLFPTEVYDELQVCPMRQNFFDVFGANPSLTGLRKQFKFTPAVYHTLCEHKRALDALLKTQRTLDCKEKVLAAQAAHAETERKRKWKSELIISTVMPEILGITRAEYQQWRLDKRIPVSEWREFHKWGRDSEVALHHPSDFAHITPMQIEAWRKADAESMSPAGRAARKRTVDKAKAQVLITDEIKKVTAKYGCKPCLLDEFRRSWARMSQEDIRFLKQDPLIWAKDLEVSFSVRIGESEETWNAKVVLMSEVPLPKNEAEVLSLVERAGVGFSAEITRYLTKKLGAVVTDTLAHYSGSLSSPQVEDLCLTLKGVLSVGVNQRDIESPDLNKRLMAGPVRQLLERVDAKRAQAVLNLQDYPKAFPLARKLERTIHFKIGGTNSGKTHFAIEALKLASSGVYLAPLRLLAMEVRDRLTAAGVPCNLMTGEEHDITPGARHTACTVEMLDVSREVEVAVIDEIQMLEDGQRGWAWTAALVGAPAKTVYVCGSETVEAPCVRVIDSLKEPHTVTRLERQTPLVVENSAVSDRTKMVNSPKGVCEGDAIIAFSRKDVLTLSARYRAKGFTVSTIYGALAPEVRRAEAERFLSGESHIVVATDAIGMGLNLPIRRVIFSTSKKFDGVSVRPLSPTEVRQIGGRAGRFGMHDTGYISAFDVQDLAHIRSALAADIWSTLSKLPIAPNLWHIEALAQVLRTTQVGTILTFFAKRIAVDSPLFATASLDETVSLGHRVDQLAPLLSLRDKFTFSCAPISGNKPSEVAYFDACIESFVAGKKKKAPTAPEWLNDTDEGYLEDAEKLSKNTSLYAWLSFKYPDVFHGGAALPALRSRTSQFIERALLHQGGFGRTSKEAFEARRNERFYDY